MPKLVTVADLMKYLADMPPDMPVARVEDSIVFNGVIVEKTTVLKSKDGFFHRDYDPTEDVSVFDRERLEAVVF